MRREQLAQDLAEAEAAGPDGATANLDGQPSLLDDDVMLDVRGPLDVTASDGMSDVQLDGAQDGERDLDDDIPTADDDFALGSNDDEDDSDEDDSDDSDDQGEEELAEMREQRAARLQRDLMAQMMRRTQETHRQALGLGDEDEVDEEDQEQMIEEDDVAGGDGGDDTGMDVDLDDDIPEAESAGGYEHTDTEAELSSSDADQAEMSFAADRAPHAVRFRGSLARTDATRNSLAVSDLLSRDGSSLLGSSPQIPRRG